MADSPAAPHVDSFFAFPTASASRSSTGAYPAQLKRSSIAHGTV
ncbi:hypothetical protein [Streptomyces sp. NPDC057301]